VGNGVDESAFYSVPALFEPQPSSRRSTAMRKSQWLKSGQRGMVATVAAPQGSYPVILNRMSFTKDIHLLTESVYAAFKAESAKSECTPIR
jgi:hypothetical protein